jgi:predicted nuclease of predicted toxin-antitoxin system
MKILADENIGRSIVEYLRYNKHDVFWIKEGYCGITDYEILKLALKNQRILLTYDQDFGSLVFLEHKLHHGIILLRLTLDNSAMHIKALNNFFLLHKPKALIGEFWKVGDEYLISNRRKNNIIIL